MFELRLQHKVNVTLIQVPHFNIWSDVYRSFYSLSPLLQYGTTNMNTFYKLLAANQQTDQLFVKFHKFLESIKKDGTHQKMDEFAVKIPDDKYDILRKWIN